ncbi:MAG: VOC family protein [Deltaproteobacteria bacterium]|nr:VOC family protein [Deltaproteobacteria bacterium]
MVQLLVNVDVDDLEKAIEFYRNALGLTLNRRLFNDTVAEMVGASSPIYLLKKPTGSAASATLATLRDYRRHWTPVHLDVAVDDLGLAVERAQVAGAILESDLQTYDWGRIAFMADPFGHGFRLLEFRNGGYEAE